MNLRSKNDEIATPERELITQKDFWAKNKKYSPPDCGEKTLGPLSVRLVPMSQLKADQTSQIEMPIKATSKIEDEQKSQTMIRNEGETSFVDNFIIAIVCFLIYGGSAAIGLLFFKDGMGAAFFSMIVGSIGFYGVYHLILKAKTGK